MSASLLISQNRGLPPSAVPLTAPFHQPPVSPVEEGVLGLGKHDLHDLHDLLAFDSWQISLRRAKTMCCVIVRSKWMGLKLTPHLLLPLNTSPLRDDLKS